FTPLPVFDIATFDLSRLKVLMIDAYSGGSPSLKLLGRLPSIQSWIANGGRLIVHDWLATGVTAQPNPLLLASPSTILVNAGGNNIEIIPPGDNLVVSGPHGMLASTSLDGGGSSYQGYARRATLPPRALPILGAGLNTNNVAAFSYGLGAGSIYYAVMPLDYLIDRE